MTRILLALILLLHIAYISSASSQKTETPLAEEISSPTNYVPQAFDVLYYDADLDLTAFPSREMNGVCSVHLKWLENPADNKFYFHLRGLEVDSVFYGKEKVEAVEKEDSTSPTYHYEITPPEGATETSASITIYYSGMATSELNDATIKWGGVHNNGGLLYSLGVGFFNNYVSTTEHWLPCYDHPSDKAKFRATFTVPEDIVVASNGIGEFIDGDEETDVYEWRHDEKCAAYNLSFAAGDFAKIEFGDSALPAPVYCLPIDTAKVKKTFKLLPNMIDAYEKLFGEYPFEKAGYVITPKGSMEHQTMISFSRTVLFQMDNIDDTVNLTAAHELAHQWFGDMVTPYDFRDAWLNEGLASYCEALWLEELFGFEENLNHIERNINQYFTEVYGVDDIPIPLYDYPRQLPWSNYPLTIYAKGAAVISMLRYELGDSLFFAGLNDYLTENKYGNVTTDSLKKSFEKVSGEDLDWFFNQWVYQIGFPELEVEVVYVDQDDEAPYEYLTCLTQVQDSAWGEYTNVPVEVSFYDADSTLIRSKVFNSFRPIICYPVELDTFPRYIKVNEGREVKALIKVKEAITTVEESINRTAELEISPNPASDKINIRKPRDLTMFNLSIYNSLGAKVLAKDCANIDASKFEITTKDLSAGVYFLIIENNGRSWKGKFSVVR